MWSLSRVCIVFFQSPIATVHLLLLPATTSNLNREPVSQRRIEYSFFARIQPFVCIVVCVLCFCPFVSFFFMLSTCASSASSSSLRSDRVPVTLLQFSFSPSPQARRWFSQACILRLPLLTLQRRLAALSSHTDTTITTIIHENIRSYLTELCPMVHHLMEIITLPLCMFLCDPVRAVPWPISVPSCLFLCNNNSHETPAPSLFFAIIRLAFYNTAASMWCADSSACYSFAVPYQAALRAFPCTSLASHLWSVFPIQRPSRGSPWLYSATFKHARLTSSFLFNPAHIRRA